MRKKSLRRTLLLAALSCAVAGGSFALHSKNEEMAVLDDFGARAHLLLKEGRYAEAKALLWQANEIDPDEAWIRILRFRTMAAKAPPGGVPKDAVPEVSTGLLKDALGELRRVPTPEKPLPEPLDLLSPLSDGTPDVFYLQATNDDTGYDSLFSEYSALLGRPSVARWHSRKPPQISSSQWLVVPTTYKHDIPKHPGKTLFLGPNSEAERALGLVSARRSAGPRDTGAASSECDLISETAALHATPTEPLSVPFSVPFEAYEAPVGMTTLATIRCADDEYPGLIRSRDGRTLIFTFDFPAWIVRLRQGDIALKNRETDDVLGIRPSDMFVRRRSIEELQVPHTDLVIEGLWRILDEGRASLRFWHHPPGARSTFIVTSDQDGATELLVDLMINALRVQGVRPTVFLMPESSPLVAKSLRPDTVFVAQAREAGVDFGMHPDLVAVPKGDRGGVIANDKAAFVRRFAFEPTVARNHWVAWWGWVAAAKRLQETGYRYDLSYLTLRSKFLHGLGYMTGSGLPLRFYDERGSPLEIRQLATQLDDHANPIVPQPVLGDVQLSRSQLYAVTHGLFERSAQRFHSPLVVNNHPGQFSLDPDWLLAMVRAARTSNVAVMNVAEYAQFIDGLLASGIRRLTDTELAILVQNPEQEILLPAHVASATVDGNEVELERVERYSRPMRSLRLARGRHILELSL